MPSPSEQQAALRGVRAGGPVPGTPLPTLTDVVPPSELRGTRAAPPVLTDVVPPETLRGTRAAPPVLTDVVPPSELRQPSQNYRPNWAAGDNSMPSASSARDLTAPPARQGFTFGDNLPPDTPRGPQVGTRMGGFTGGVEDAMTRPGVQGTPPDKWNGGLRGGLRDAARGAGEITDVFSGAEKFGRGVAAGARALAPVARAAGGVGVISNFNDYKIDDPSVDSSIRGTLRAFGQGGARAGFDSLGKGLLETGMDLGSNVANGLDLLVPGKAPVSTAYNALLHDTFGSQLIDRSGNGHQGVRLIDQSAAAATNPQAPTAPTPAFTDEDAALNKRFAAAPGGGSITALTTDGVRNLSNLRANPFAPGGTAGAPAPQSQEMTQQLQGARAQRDQTERGLLAGYAATEDARQQTLERQAITQQRPDTSAIDKRLAASTSLNEQKILGDQREAILRESGVRQQTAMTGFNTEATNTASTTNARAANMLGMYNAQREQGNADRTFGAGRVDAQNAQRKANLEERQSADKAFTDKLATFNTSTVDGKPVVNNEAVAAHKMGITAYLADEVAKAEQAGRPDLAATLRSQGPAALSDQRLQQLLVSLSAKQANADNSSKWNPFRGARVDSDNPDQYAITGIEKNTLTPNMYIHANGARTPVGVLDNVDGSPLVNLTNAPTDRYNIIKHGARQ